MKNKELTELLKEITEKNLNFFPTENEEMQMLIKAIINITNELNEKVKEKE